MKNYVDWKISEWTTPLSNEEGLLLESLMFGVDGLVLTVSSPKSGRRFKIEFKGESSFRVIDEGYRNDLWERIHANKTAISGNTWIVENTDFLDFLYRDCIFKTVANTYQEFLVRAGDDIIEIVTNAAPEISETLLVQS